MAVAKPEIEHVESFTVAGIHTRTKNTDEVNPNTAKLHQLWERFFTVEIPNRKPDSFIYGVYSDYETDHNGLYTVTAGYEVTSDPSDNELSVKKIEKGDYLVFKNKGPMPQVIYETWQAIWRYFELNPDVVRAYKTDFEMCPNLEECCVFIGIKK